MVLPSLDAYIRRLPLGLGSYPEAEVKASVLRTALDRMPASARAPTGIAELDRLIERPPSVNVWIPEASLNAVLLAVYDASFARQGGLGAFEKWIGDVNAALLKGPVYRILFAVMTPAMLLEGFESRWSAFRRGTSIKIESHGPGSAVVRHICPPYLMQEVARTGLGSAFVVAIEAAGAKQPSAEFRELSPTETRFELRWT